MESQVRSSFNGGFREHLRAALHFNLVAVPRCAHGFLLASEGLARPSKKRNTFLKYD